MSAPVDGAFWMGNELVQSTVMGILVASAFPVGAAIAATHRFPKRIKGNLAAVAAGMYISTLSFSLVEEGVKVSSFPVMASGFVVGAVAFSIAHPILKGRKDLKEILALKPSAQSKHSSGSRSHVDGKSSDSDMSIVGTILDSVPENLFIGAIIAMNLSGLSAALIALFLGNLAATMEGAQRMIASGMKRVDVIKRWALDFAIVAPAGLIGWYAVKPLGDEGMGGIIGFAAGALLVFVTVDLIPKAYGEIKWHIGMSVTLGLISVLAIFHYLG